MRHHRPDFEDTQPLHGTGEFDGLPSRKRCQRITGQAAPAREDPAGFKLHVAVVHMLKHLVARYATVHHRGDLTPDERGLHR